MMFLAGLFLSIGMALAQTQATGTVTAAEDGAPIIGASIKRWLVQKRVLLPT